MVTDGRKQAALLQSDVDQLEDVDEGIHDRQKRRARFLVVDELKITWGKSGNTN